MDPGKEVEGQEVLTCLALEDHVTTVQEVVSNYIMLNLPVLSKSLWLCHFTGIDLKGVPACHPMEIILSNTKYASTHLSTWMERGTMRVKCFTQEHNIVTPARAQTWTSQAKMEHANH